MFYRTVLACLCCPCLLNIGRVLKWVWATKHSVTCLYNFGIPAIRNLLSVFSAAVKWLDGMLLRLKEAGCRLSFQFCDHPTIQTCPTSLHDQLCSSTWHSAFNHHYFGSQDGLLRAMMTTWMQNSFETDWEREHCSLCVVSNWLQHLLLTFVDQFLYKVFTVACHKIAFKI